ncbi:N-acetyl-1-D-myo-inositol-2-amino-2-deoxy-alpha-D-glucopyranoside deacetylase [Salinibacterium sp. CAN_S4]|uniref:PIG-L family deacetylase n=1 Tax=Salinibacterium sp. CAN_S4 TaxID=2787727 RepID=UPI0018EFA357
MTERVLFVHAHPDDETIATGAAIATLIERGAIVTVLTCTRGELGEVIPAELRHLSGVGLASERERELREALAALGVTDHLFLGLDGARWEGRPPRRYLDSGMQWGPNGAQALQPMHPESLSAAELGDVAADIATVIIDREPDVVVSYAADGGYGHPDHVRAHDATRAAAEVVRVPFYVVDSPGSKPGPFRVDAEPVLERKRAALAAHRTQVTLDGDTFSLSSGAARPIAQAETYTRVHPAGVSGFHDQSLVSRVAALVVATLLGAFAGVTLTAAHQATIAVGPLTVPWGVVTAVIVTAAILVGLRVVFETRIVAGCAAIGLLGASALLAIQTSGGSVLVPANPAGYTWTYAPVIIAAIVLAWPRFTRPVPSLRPGNIGSSASKGSDLL